MIENIVSTSSLFAIVSFLVISMHGDHKPSFAVMMAELSVFLLSSAFTFVGVLILIWQ